MKKILLITIAISAMACSKKTDVKPAPTIDGTWKYTTRTYTPITNGVVSLPIITQLDGSETLTFNNDGTGMDKNENGTTHSESFTYALSNQSITLTYPGNQYQGVIKTLTLNTLEIYYNYPIFTEDDIYTR